MDVSEARIFLTLADELHFGHAADRLHMAQPVLSRSIRALEKKLGATLFDRSTRSVKLTIVGRSLIEPAHALILASDAVQEAAKDLISGNRGSVSIGFSGAALNPLVSRLVTTLRREKPAVQIKLRTGVFSNQSPSMILDGNLDFAVGRWDYLPAGLSSMKLASEQLLVALPSSDPRGLETDRLPISVLRNEKWIVLPAGQAATLQSRLSLLAASQGWLPQISHTAPDSSTQLMLVGVGEGYALTLDSVSRQYSSTDVRFVELEEVDSEVIVQLIWKSGSLNPAVQSTLNSLEGTDPPLLT